MFLPAMSRLNKEKKQCRTIVCTNSEKLYIRALSVHNKIYSDCKFVTYRAHHFI